MKAFALGKAVTAYTAVFFSQNRELWGTSRYIAAARPDQEGRFTVKTLAPGDYRVVAVEHIDEDTWTDPDFLNSVWGASVSLSLHEDETATIGLKLTELR